VSFSTGLWKIIEMADDFGVTPALPDDVESVVSVDLDAVVDPRAVGYQVGSNSGPLGPEMEGMEEDNGPEDEGDEW
jgi:hypothetical protein